LRALNPCPRLMGISIFKQTDFSPESGLFLEKRVEPAFRIGGRILFGRPGLPGGGEEVAEIPFVLVQYPFRLGFPAGIVADRVVMRAIVAAAQVRPA
jgi:hypothetical protein